MHVRMDNEYHVAVLGAGGVGKSAMTIRFVQRTFVSRYDPTIEDKIDGSAYVLHIADTAGQEEYKAMRDNSIKSAEGFVIVYSVISRESFEAVEVTYNSVSRIKEQRTCAVIAGNKADIADLRAVPKEEGAALGKRLGCPHIECSARTPTNIDEVFVSLVGEMERLRKAESVQPRRGSKRVRRCALF